MTSVDQQYFLNEELSLPLRKHAYGQQVWLLNHPYLLAQVAKLSSPECKQPELNRILTECYADLTKSMLAAFFKCKPTNVVTRMQQNHPEGVYSGNLVDPSTKVVILSLARAGILPSFAVFETLLQVLRPENVRIDHVTASRKTDASGAIVGASIEGSKIGGDIQDAILVVPDPMGATGTSISQVLDLYFEQTTGKPSKIISLQLMITPEFIRKILRTHPTCHMMSPRLDRAFSSERALQSIPGMYPDEEKGLNEHGYIVPGAGGLGELTTNAWV